MFARGGGAISVRADRCWLGAEGMPVEVVTVEYQGTSVRVALRTGAGEEASVVMPDREFYSKPVEAGVGTGLVWDARDERALMS